MPNLDDDSTDLVVDDDTTTVDPMELSDEDFFKLEAPEFSLESADDDDETTAEVDTAEDIEDKTEDNDDPGPADEDIVDPEKTEDDDADAATESDADDKKVVDPDDDSTATEEAQDDSDAEQTSDTDDASIDYKAEYEKLTAPFKANGTNIKVKNSEDAIRLMQMGANYHKKMAGLKPSLKTLKLLEKNNLLDDNKLNFLIDVNNKEPEAIKKLLKDSDIDPMDIDLKTDSNYTPTPRTVSDTELALDMVLEEIQDSPAYAKTLNVVTKEWDATSRDEIAQTPRVMKILNNHIEAGVYDTVMDAVNYERSVGKLEGISDFVAYKNMGDTLLAAGKLGSPPNSENNQQDKINKTNTSDADKKRKERKNAVKATKTAKTSATTTYNPLDMSDEDFANLDPKHFTKVTK